MTNKPTRTVEEIITHYAHPLEAHFGIEPGTTEMVTTERSSELVVANGYDDKDNELEQDFQEIADKALDVVDILKDELTTAEPKYKARLIEVLNQSLNTAAGAIAQRQRMKEHRDKMELQTQKAKKGHTTVRNNIIIDRNELLRQIRGTTEPEEKVEVIDVEVTPVKDNQ